MNDFICSYNEEKNTPFKINNSSKYDNKMSQGSFEVKITCKNITKEFVNLHYKKVKNKVKDHTNK